MTDSRNPNADEKKRWLDDPKNVDKIWYGLIAICVLLFVADFFVVKHPYFKIETLPNFWGFYGFISCVVLVRAAAQLRRVLMREEDYYEKIDAEFGADDALKQPEGGSGDAAGRSDGVR